MGDPLWNPRPVSGGFGGYGGEGVRGPVLPFPPPGVGIPTYGGPGDGWRLWGVGWG